MMDCQTCNDLLLDLAYGELDEVRAAAVRKHADACADCRRALRRIAQGRSLARQLVTEEPPPISAALRAALEAATARPAAVVAAPSSMVPPSSSGSVNGELTGRNAASRRWFDRVGEFAMRRQVAMAAVFVLTIGVGFIYYQSHPRPDGALDDRVPDVVPAVEVSTGPSARAGNSVVPAAQPNRVRPTSLNNTNALTRVPTTPPTQAQQPPPGERAADEQRARANNAVAANEPARPDPQAAQPSGNVEITPQHRPVAVNPGGDNSDEMRPAPQTPPLGTSAPTQVAQQAPPPPVPNEQPLNPFVFNQAAAQQGQQAVQGTPAPRRAALPPGVNGNFSVNNPSFLAPGESEANNAAQGSRAQQQQQQQQPQQPAADVHAREQMLRQQIAAAPSTRDADERRLSLGRLLPITGRYDEAIQTLRQIETPELRAQAQSEIASLEQRRVAAIERNRAAAARRGEPGSRPPSVPSVMSRPARRAAQPMETNAAFSH